MVNLMRNSDGGRPTDAEHEAMIQRVIQIGREAGILTGIHVLAPHDALRRAEQGMQFIAIDRTIPDHDPHHRSSKQIPSDSTFWQRDTLLVPGIDLIELQ